ncbi:hypothetical protein GCM10023231_00890 [Olivibacter ginsenosidimutans]|uniref:DUF4837 family protein n=2 Tax=Olivibacter ginsenosidimutans TaxID=1176537 RepID=A0ABP9ABZ6_9SPHI
MFLALLSCKDQQHADDLWFSPILVNHIEQKNYKGYTKALESFTHNYLKIIDSINRQYPIVVVDTNKYDDTQNMYTMEIGIKKNLDRRIKAAEKYYVKYIRNVTKKQNQHMMVENGFQDIAVYPKDIQRVYNYKEIQFLVNVGRLKNLTYVGELLPPLPDTSANVNVSIDTVTISGAFDDAEICYLKRLINNSGVLWQKDWLERDEKSKINFVPNFLKDHPLKTDYFMNIKVSKDEEGKLVFLFDYGAMAGEVNTLIPQRLSKKLVLSNEFDQQIKPLEINREIGLSIKQFIDNQLFITNK